MVDITTPPSPIIQRVQTETSVSALIGLRVHFFSNKLSHFKGFINVQIEQELEQVFVSPSFIHWRWHGFFIQRLTSRKADVDCKPSSEDALDLLLQACFLFVSLFYLCHLCAGRLWFQGDLVFFFFFKVTEILILLPCSIHAFTCELVPPTDRAGYNGFTLKLGTLIVILLTEWNQSNCVAQSSETPENICVSTFLGEDFMIVLMAGLSNISNREFSYRKIESETVSHFKNFKTLWIHQVTYRGFIVALFVPITHVLSVKTGLHSTEYGEFVFFYQENCQ